MNRGAQGQPLHEARFRSGKLGHAARRLIG